jgi:hypothetical protein
VVLWAEPLHTSVFVDECEGGFGVKMKVFAWDINAIGSVAGGIAVVRYAVKSGHLRANGGFDSINCYDDVARESLSCLVLDSWTELVVDGGDFLIEADVDVEIFGALQDDVLKIGAVDHADRGMVFLANARHQGDGHELLVVGVTAEGVAAEEGCLLHDLLEQPKSG